MTSLFARRTDDDESSLDGGAARVVDAGAAVLAPVVTVKPTEHQRASVAVDKHAIVAHQRTATPHLQETSHGLRNTRSVLTNGLPRPTCRRHHTD